MKEIIVSSSAKECVVVNDANTAVAVGSGSLDVFGTPAMIALMEKATCKAIEGFLDENETSVGIKIEVSHDKASGVGEEICASASVVEVQGRRVCFEVLANDSKGDIIGKGKIERFIVDKQKFMSKVEAK